MERIDTKTIVNLKAVTSKFRQDDKSINYSILISNHDNICKLTKDVESEAKRQYSNE